MKILYIQIGANDKITKKKEDKILILTNIENERLYLL